MSTHKHVDMICLTLCLTILVVVGRRRGIWPKWGVPWHEEASGTPALPPHIWPQAPGRGRLRFQGTHVGALISAHGVRGRVG